VTPLAGAAEATERMAGIARMLEVKAFILSLL
jgi:hypothetical protein